MADCGAGGSALDRASRAFLASTSGGGAGQQYAGVGAKHIGHAAAAVLGHAAASTTTTGSSFAAMPVAAPTQLILSQQSQQQASSARAPTAMATNHPGMRAPMHHQQQNFHAQQHQQHASLHQQQNHHHQQQQHHNMMMMQHQQQQNQAAAFVAAEQQKMMMMMQMHHQQEHIMRLQAMQQQQILLQQQQQQAASKALDEEAAVEGHAGIVQPASMDELAAAWREVQQEFDTNDNMGHEGIAPPASIEELAAAWAECQEEYEQLEEAVNLASAYTDEQVGEYNDVDHHDAALPAYGFINKVQEDNLTQSATDATNVVDEYDWMSDGIRYFEAGDLKDAIHAFEMELQRNNPDNALAWRMLGQCHAENDQDPSAIVCFEHAVDRDPYSSQARLALGVSYVNELQHNKALQHLKEWITHNPTFAGTELESEVDVYGSAGVAAKDAVENGPEAERAFDEVQRLLLRALEFAQTHSDDDTASVLEALGVVYNVSRDYEAAVDAFQKAILKNPNDYQLYNRLGATLANFHKSDKALPAYRKALQIKPKYARAWLNMAISHANLQNYEQAARCYLQTLSLNPSAVHCWSYLRIALSCDEKWDLIPHAANMDLNAFKDHYDFVMYDNIAS